MNSRSLPLWLGLVIVAAPRLAAQEPPDTPIELERLVVTAHKLPVPLRAISASVTVLDGVDLEAAGYATVLDALRSVPGLAVTQSGSFGSVGSVFMRGGESDYVGVLIDGVQVNEPGGRFDFGHLTIQQIDRIEIVRGPVSTMYGSDAVAGVIHIITRTGSGKPGGRLSLLGGTNSSFRGSAEVDGAADFGAYGFSLSGTRSDGTLPINNDYDNLTLRGRLDVTPDDRTDARLSAQYSDHTFHFPTDGAGAIVDGNSLNFGDELTVGLEASRRLSSRATLSLLAAARDTRAGTDDLPDGPADTLGFFAFQSADNILRRSVDVKSTLEGGPLGTAAIGLEYEEQKLRAISETESEFGSSDTFAEHERSNLAYYGQWLGRWGSFAADASGRLEDNEAFGTLATWSLGSAYLVTGTGTKLRATIGRGIKEPTLLENFATGFALGNPDLEPEESLSWEAGFDQFLAGGDVRASATYFDQAFDRLIQFTFAPPEPGDPNYFNVAAADVRGFEAELSAEFGPVSLSAGYTYLDATVTDAGFDSGPDATFVEGERLLRRPAHQASLAARAGFGGGSAGVTVRRVGNRVDRDFSTFPALRVTLPAYTTVDTHGEVTLVRRAGSRPGASITWRVENLFDDSYSEISGFPARGRTIWIGGRLAFGG